MNNKLIQTEHDHEIEFVPDFGDGDEQVEYEEEPKETSEIDPKNTPDPMATPTPQSTDIPYVPDPIVEDVIKLKGSEFRLKDNTKNILVIGFDPKSNLTDTIIIVSVSDDDNTIDCYSIPRATYVRYDDEIEQFLEEKGYSTSPGIYKINAAYTIGRMTKQPKGNLENSGLDFLVSTLQQAMPDANITIDDYVFVDYNGLDDVVDILGGANVYFPEDYWYPTEDGTGMYLGYTKGYHSLNGTETVAYLRRRYRYDENGRISSSGDPYRKVNQMRFVKDFASQVITQTNILNFNALLDAASDFMYHSLNNIDDIMYYLKVASGYTNGKYECNYYVIPGKTIDPLGDHCSYVDVLQ